MTEQSSTEEAYADEIDLSSIFAVLWKRRILIVFGTLGATLLSIGISLLLPRVYRSEGFYQLGNPAKKIETFDFTPTLDGLRLTEHPTRRTGGAWYGNIEGVDQTSFLAMSERAMIEMCQRTGRIDMMKKYERNLAKRTEAIRTKMWDPETKFFYSLNRNTDKKIRVRTLQGFLTLTAGLASVEQARELVRHLKDPALFWSKYPVTTSAMDEPTFRPDGFWRGDIWPPTNYLIALGSGIPCWQAAQECSEGGEAPEDKGGPEPGKE